MNLDIEFYILGAVINNDLNINQINTDYFVSPEIKKILKEVKNQTDKNLDTYAYLENIARTNTNISISTLGDALQQYSISSYNITNALKILETNKINRDIQRLVLNLQSKENVTIEYLENTLKQIKSQQTDEFVDSVQFCESFLKENKDKKIAYVSSGFSKLDFMLGGGFLSGVYAIGAGSSLGKTTLVQEIADNIALNGSSVLYFALEMSKTEMIAKTITRVSHKLNKFDKSSTQIIANDMTESDYDKIEKSRLHINKILKNITYEGNIFESNIQEIIKKIYSYKNKYKRVPVIVIDYLQIVQSDNDKHSEKQAADRVVALLKQLSNDLGAIVILVSSIGRANYLSYIDLSSFKESGGIEYGVDCAIGLQLTAIYEIMGMPSSKESEKRELFNKAKSDSPRRVELVILKNRGSRVGLSHTYSYFPAFNYFVEDDDTSLMQKITNPAEIQQSFEGCIE